MSVRRAQREIDSAEFAEWMAYAAIEPFGPVREDQRAGVVAAITANVNRDSSAHPEPFTVEDFLPRYEGEPEEQPTDEEKLKSKLMTWATTMGDQKRPKSEKRPRKAKETQGARPAVQEAEAGGDGLAGGLSARGGGGTATPGPPPSS